MNVPEDFNLTLKLLLDSRGDASSRKPKNPEEGFRLFQVVLSKKRST